MVLMLILLMQMLLLLLILLLMLILTMLMLLIMPMMMIMYCDEWWCMMMMTEWLDCWVCKTKMRLSKIFTHILGEICHGQPGYYTTEQHIRQVSTCPPPRHQKGADHNACKQLTIKIQCLYVGMYVGMYVCMYIYAYMSIYI